ncbi:pyridoxal phosphate-dependent decarboxylase family protein [Microbulbifer litoralis]|uniref:pyridoxal phosphate-dependent decarboxylase family protein n=1 Tax=Microbulbifer litoralis TaxID=2933965 RepID=UPI002028F41E|nr:pyridoxal-dependent decarboxylase [Microbulbifer sp. GX H0434]
MREKRDTGFILENFPGLHENEASLLKNSIEKSLKSLSDLASEGSRYQFQDYDPFPNSLNLAPQNITSSIEKCLHYLHNSPIWGHPKNLKNITAGASTSAITAALIANIANSNMVSESFCYELSRAEKLLVRYAAEIIGFCPERASGISTFGGTGTLLYALRVGIEKALRQGPESQLARSTPDGSMARGLHGAKLVVFTSQAAHYSVKTCSSWLGLGSDSVISVPTHADGSLNTQILREALNSSITGKATEIIKSSFPERSVKILESRPNTAGIIATAGTTSGFILDNLHEIRNIRDQFIEDHSLNYAPHLHADAVVGWPWCALNTSEMTGSGKSRPSQEATLDLHRIAQKIHFIALFDSAGLDFHKTGYTPISSSLILFSNKNKLTACSPESDDDLKLITGSAGSDAHFLFEEGDYHPCNYSLETTRSSSGILSALSNLHTFGIKGIQKILFSLTESRRTLCHALTQSTNLEQEKPGSYSSEKPEKPKEYCNHKNKTLKLFQITNIEDPGTITIFTALPYWLNKNDIIDNEVHDNDYISIAISAINKCIYNSLEKLSLKENVTQLSPHKIEGPTQLYEGKISVNNLIALKAHITSPLTDATSAIDSAEDIKSIYKSIKPETFIKEASNILQKYYANQKITQPLKLNDFLVNFYKHQKPIIKDPSFAHLL